VDEVRLAAVLVGDLLGDVDDRPADAALAERRGGEDEHDRLLADEPDGVAIIAVDEDSGRLIQYYFDSRGVVRQYETRIEALVKLSPGFAQRFRGEFSASGETIADLPEGRLARAQATKAPDPGPPSPDSSPLPSGV
jgi:hypothetical protein